MASSRSLHESWAKAQEVHRASLVMRRNNDYSLCVVPYLNLLEHGICLSWPLIVVIDRFYLLVEARYAVLTTML